MDSIHSWIDKDEVSRLADSLSSSPERMKEWKRLESDGFAMPEKQGEVNSVAQPAAPEVPPVEAPVVQAESETPAVSLQSIEESQDVLATQVIDKQRTMLAGASEMAKSSGLIHSEKEPAVAAAAKTQKTENVLEQIEATKVVLPAPAEQAVDTQVGTFVLVNQMLSEQIHANGISVIDIDGDVLFDNLENVGLTHYVSNVMKTSSLMQVGENDVCGMRIKSAASEWLEFISVHCTRGVVLVASRVQHSLTAAKRQETGDKLRTILNAQ